MNLVYLQESNGLLQKELCILRQEVEVIKLTLLKIQNENSITILEVNDEKKSCKKGKKVA